MADVDAKVWDLVALAGVESSADPFGQGGEPPPDPTSWNLPATLNVQQSGNIPLRQYAVNATGWTISVSGLPTGVTYNASLERLEGASTGTASGTATFTLSLSGQADVVDTATVALVEASDPFAAALWYDDFDYDSSYWASQTDNAFTVNGPWTSARDNRDNVTLRANISTVAPSAIPGNSINPCAQSSRVLRMEFLSYEGFDTQAVGFLLRGTPGNPEACMPANVWIQQWVRFVQSGDEQSQPPRGKWYYPCRGQAASCSNLSWLMNTHGNADSQNPLCITATDGVFMVDNGFSSSGMDDVTIDGDFMGGCASGAWKRGPANANHKLLWNRWYLMKTHYDTSGPGGVWECWIREYGSPTWVKIADWRTGTPSNYVWSIPVERRLGHDFFNLGSTQDWPLWAYSGDFVVATAEENLPAYTDGS